MGTIVKFRFLVPDVLKYSSKAESFINRSATAVNNSNLYFYYFIFYIFTGSRHYHLFYIATAADVIGWDERKKKCIYDFGD